MEEALQGVLQHHRRPQAAAHALDGLHHRVDHVRGRLEDVWPDQVEQVLHRVLQAEADGAEREMLDGGARHVVAPHLANVLEQKGERLEHAVLHVELRDAVLVEQTGQHGEGRARLGHDGDGDGGADAVLPLLHLEVVEQRGQHVLRADGLGNVPKRVDGRPPDGLLVRAQHVEQLKANAHPLARRHELGAAIGDAADEIDAVLLHHLVPVLEDGREAGQQVLDGRGHLGHPDDVDNRLEGAQNGAEHLGVLLPQVLVQDHTQVAHELLLVARAHHHGDPRDEIGGLLPHLGRLVVEPPLDGAADLRQVRLGALAQRADDGAEAVEHHGRVLGGLLLEGVQNAVDQLLLEPLVNVGGRQRGNDLLDRLHHHLPVRLRLVLQVLHDARDDLGGAHLLGELLSRLHQRLVVAPVQRHPADPEVLEELGQDLGPHVRRLHTLGGHALLDHLEHNLLHLLVGRGELAQQDNHHLAGVVVCVLRVHERDDVADGLEEGGQPLAAVLPDALPQRLEHRVEGLDAGGERERRDGPHLLLLVAQARLDDLDERAQVRQHRAAHQDGDLLHNLDARVPCLPRLFGLADRLEEGQQRRHAERRRHDREGASGGVAHVLVDVVNVGPHRGDHRGQARRLCQVGDDLAPLDARVVVLVDEQRLDHDEDFVHKRPDQIVQLVQHAVDHLDEQVALLVLECRRHEQRQDLVEEGAGTELARLVGQLPEGLLAHRRRPVLHLEQQLHDLALPRLLRSHVLDLVVLLEQGGKVLVVFGLDEGQAGGGRGHVAQHPAARLLRRELVQRRRALARRGSRQKLPGRSADGHVGVRRLEHPIADRREDRVQVLIRERAVPVAHLALPPYLLHLLRRLCAERARSKWAKAHAANHWCLRVDGANGCCAGRGPKRCGADGAGHVGWRLVPTRALRRRRHRAPQSARRRRAVPRAGDGAARRRCLIPPVLLPRGRGIDVTDPARGRCGVPARGGISATSGRRRRVPLARAVGAPPWRGCGIPLAAIGSQAPWRRCGVPLASVGPDCAPWRRRRIPSGRGGRAPHPTGSRSGVPLARVRYAAGSGRGIPPAGVRAPPWCRRSVPLAGVRYPARRGSGVPLARVHSSAGRRRRIPLARIHRPPRGGSGIPSASHHRTLTTRGGRGIPLAAGGCRCRHVVPPRRLLLGCLVRRLWLVPAPALLGSGRIRFLLFRQLTTNLVLLPRHFGLRHHIAVRPIRCVGRLVRLGERISPRGREHALPSCVVLILSVRNALRTLLENTLALRRLRNLLQ
eukprot:scaffold28112_cov112-Isochrysis_galbana.AAC.2